MTNQERLIVAVFNIFIYIIALTSLAFMYKGFQSFSPLDKWGIFGLAAYTINSLVLVSMIVRNLILSYDSGSDTK